MFLDSLALSGELRWSLWIGKLWLHLPSLRKYLAHCSKRLYNYTERSEGREVALSKISWTNLHLVLDVAKVFLCHRLCSEFLWTEILVGAKLWKASTLVASSLLLVGKVVLLASSEVEPIPLRNDRNQLRWLNHLPSILPEWTC